jgi:hypothetical protein
VGAAEGQRGLAALTAEGVRQGIGGMIVGTDGVGPSLSEPPTQVADRSRGQTKRGRETRRRFTAESPLVELPPYGDRDWSWHRKALLGCKKFRDDQPIRPC